MNYLDLSEEPEWLAEQADLCQSEAAAERQAQQDALENYYTRPRDPETELPADGQIVTVQYQDYAGGPQRRLVGSYDAKSQTVDSLEGGVSVSLPEIELFSPPVIAWWPVPPMPEAADHGA